MQDYMKLRVAAHLYANMPHSKYYPDPLSIYIASVNVCYFHMLRHINEQYGGRVPNTN